MANNDDYSKNNFESNNSKIKERNIETIDNKELTKVNYDFNNLNLVINNRRAIQRIKIPKINSVNRNLNNIKNDRSLISAQSTKNLSLSLSKKKPEINYQYLEKKKKNDLLLLKKYSNVNLFKSKFSGNLTNSIDNIFNYKKKHLSNNLVLLPKKKIKERNNKIRDIFNDIYSLNLKNFDISPNNNIHIYNNNSVEVSLKHNKTRQKTLKKLESYNYIPKENKSLNLSNKEKEKLLINQNLRKLLFKIREKIVPKKKVILSPRKLPFIENQKKQGKRNSCIHKIEYFENSSALVKTHIDGMSKEEKMNPTHFERKYQINEGYIDLNVLNNGDNLSFKTNLIEKDGLVYYEFSKDRKLDTVEEKVHRIKKDRKEFKHLLEKYRKNELFILEKNKDFNLVKKSLNSKPIFNDNVYKDLFYMITKHNEIY